MKSKKISRKKESIFTEDSFKPENVKVTISIRVSEALLNAYRAEAERLELGYQTLMQMKLREGLDNPIEKRLSAIEQKLKKHG